jgi:trans-L-3-hydroxyproline dehydratase
MTELPLLPIDWSPPDHWQRIRTIDAHAAGEPLRIILAGLPELEGDTILERRSDASRRYDHLRTALMWEPRGHADMYGCIITPPVTETAHFGVLFTHNEGYSSMCGHGIIAVTKVALETGLLPIEKPITRVGIDTPAGLVTAYARIENNSVASVYFHNVPSFVDQLDLQVEVPGMGRVTYDLAFGGAYYAYVDAMAHDLELSAANVNELIDKGRTIKQAVTAQRQIVHPFENDLNFLYGTIFIGPPHDPAHHSRNVCIFAEGEVDRSPTGTGISGRMALHYARDEVRLGETIEIESLIGSTFTGKIVEETTFGPHKAIIPEVEGTAYITGINEFVIDPDDPLKQGFILR